MTFGQFYTRVCEQLKTGYGWSGPVMYLSTHPELLDIIYNHYQQYSSNPLDLQGVVESAALNIDQNH